MRAYNLNRKDWSVLTKSRNGTVSILKNMNLAEAIAVYERLDPWYGEYLPTEQWESHQTIRHCRDGDIVMREIIGPQEWSIDDQPLPHWPRERPADD